MAMRKYFCERDSIRNEFVLIFSSFSLWVRRAVSDRGLSFLLIEWLPGMIPRA